MAEHVSATRLELLATQAQITLARQGQELLPELRHRYGRRYAPEMHTKSAQGVH